MPQTAQKSLVTNIPDHFFLSVQCLRGKAVQMTELFWQISVKTGKFFSHCRTSALNNKLMPGIQPGA